MPIPIKGRSGGQIKQHQSKAQLNKLRLNLLLMMQHINFGRIEKLQIVKGDPVTDPRPVIVREFKFGGDNGPRPELRSSDFSLKQQLVELFAFFDEHPEVVIDVLDIKHGLPFRMIVSE